MSEKEKLRLITRSQQGDIEAFEKLIRSNMPYIAHVAFSTLKNQQDAEDAMQNAVIVMYKSIESLRTAAAFNGWMYQIVYNTCLKIVEKNKKAGHSLDETAEGVFVEERRSMLPEPSSEEQEQKALLLEKINELPHKYQLPLAMFYYEELSYSEIAEALGASVQDVSNWIFRAKKKLKKSLESDKRAEGWNKAAATEAGVVGAALGVGDAAIAEGVIEHAKLQVTVDLDALTASSMAGLKETTALDSVIDEVVTEAVKEEKRSSLLGLFVLGVSVVAVGALMIGFTAFGDGSYGVHTPDVQMPKIVAPESAQNPSPEEDDKDTLDDPTDGSAPQGETSGSGVSEIEEFEIDNEITYEVPGTDRYSPLEGTSNVVTTTNEDAYTSFGVLTVKTGDIPYIYALGGIVLVSAVVLVTWYCKRKRDKKTRK